MKRIALVDADTGQVLAEWPRRKTSKCKTVNEDTPELLAVLAVALVALLLAVLI